MGRKNKKNIRFVIILISTIIGGCYGVYTKQIRLEDQQHIDHKFNIILEEIKKNSMKFEIIPNEQTPKVPEIDRGLEHIYHEENFDQLEAFLEFASKQENAVGLAANQCSFDGERVMLRAFALRDLKNDGWKLIINPVITEYVGISEDRAEGCLTWGGRKIIANRYRGVRVTYFDINSSDIIENELHKGFEGQIWQHEINHLNGVEESVVERNHPDPKEVIVGRNEPCPCNSGKKYKKCCLTLIQ